MDYTNFLTYPIQILGITESYNSEIEAIKNVVLNDLEYSGGVSDLDTVLPYFVFYYFCERNATTVSAQTGEQMQVAEFTIPSIEKQIKVWNLGAKMLNDICIENNTTCESKFISQRNLL